MSCLDISNLSSQLQDEGPYAEPHDPDTNIELMDDSAPTDDVSERALSSELSRITQSVYALPESLGLHVVKVGDLLDVEHETNVIEELTKTYRKFQLPSLLRTTTARHLGKALPTIPVIISSKARAPWTSQRYCQQSDGRLEQSGREVWNSVKDRIPEEDGSGKRDQKRGTVDGQAAIIHRRIRGLPDCLRMSFLNQVYQYESKGEFWTAPIKDNFLVSVYLGAKSNWSPLPDHNGDESHELVADEKDLDEETVPLLKFPGYLDLLSQYCSSQRSKPIKLTQRMAYGYAALHWGAGFDGRGIEFLLGLTETSRLNLHMLGFAECEPFVRWTRKGVREQLVPAAVGNGPYIPRPCVSPGLWRIFATYYLYSSRVILESNAGLEAWAVGDGGISGFQNRPLYNDLHDAEEEVKRICHICGLIFSLCLGVGDHSLNGCVLEGFWDGDYYSDADEKIQRLPLYFTRELENAFIEADAEKYASGVSSSAADRDYEDEESGSEAESDEGTQPHQSSEPEVDLPENPIIYEWTEGDVSSPAKNKNGILEMGEDATFEEPLPKKTRR